MTVAPALQILICSVGTGRCLTLQPAFWHFDVEKLYDAFFHAVGCIENS